MLGKPPSAYIIYQLSSGRIVGNIFGTYTRNFVRYISSGE